MRPSLGETPAVFAHHRQDRIAPWLVLACGALSCGLLWTRLLSHLSKEWSLNPQYSYGAAVPFLCAYLAYLEIKEGHHGRLGRLPWLWIVAGAAIAYPMVRLLQEANPEWRFVSWSLALITLSVTCWVWVLVRGAVPRLRTVQTNLLFPLCFFLVAVPWPTFLEHALIQNLTRFNAFCTVEWMNLAGVPAIQHGNTIEVGTGSVGINEACSGIRSFQASLMISLFLGHLYRFSARSRVLLCLGGFALAVLFNICRTVVLSWVAAKQGISAIDRWHDPTGVLILVLCFVTLWLLSGWIAERRARGAARAALEEPVPSAHCSRAPGSLAWAPIALLLVLMVSELAVHAWYAAGEPDAQPRVWTVTLPKHSVDYQEISFSQEARQMLRFDSGRNAKWRDAAGAWQAIFLQWNPGAAAVHLAKSHTPEACLTASGRRIEEQSALVRIIKGDLEFPVRFYHLQGQRIPLHVLYCLWEDRPVAERTFSASSLSLSSRLEPVLNRRRNFGQRSLELALWAPLEKGAARDALVQAFLHMVQPTPAFCPP